MRTLRSIQKQAKALYDLLRNPHMVLGTIVIPTEKFVRELHGALHEGTVGRHPQFWQNVVNDVLEEVASDEHAVKLVAGGEPTLFEQVTRLVEELELFLKRQLLRGHNRYALVTAFVKSLAGADHIKSS